MLRAAASSTIVAAVGGAKVGGRKAGAVSRWRSAGGALASAGPTVSAATRSYSRTAFDLSPSDGSGNDNGSTAARTKTKEEKMMERKEKKKMRRRQRLLRDETELQNRRAAVAYNRERAAYHRRVSALRKRYADEVAAEQAADEAERKAIQEELTRKRLERQRLKNIKSVMTAIRQEEIRKQREAEFNEHLKRQQQIREASRERFRAARQLVVDELEEEAPLWLTTPEEVDAAFTPEAEQLLWARSGGVLGAPNPSLDCHYWQFETHTWHMDRTYPSQREVLLREIEEMAYERANIDPSIWTDERLAERTALEEKAKLRAMVYSAGRAELLKKQRQLLLEQVAADEEDVESVAPKPEPVPNLRFLRNDRAIESEGAKLLLDDPTKFFIFSDQQQQQQQQQQSDDTDDASKYRGPAMGAPVALRDALREGRGTVFPQIIGKFPEPDTRTEREKKQQERQERMWAAASSGSGGVASGGSDPVVDDIELAAQARTAEELEPDIDYDEIEEELHRKDDEDWRKGLDPVADRDIINTPRDRRYRPADIEWVAQQLEAKIEYQEQQLAQDVASLKYQLETELREKREEEAAAAAAAGGEEETGKNDDEEEMDAIATSLVSLSEKQLLALSDLDDRFAEAQSTEEGVLSDEEIDQYVEENIPGLSKTQVMTILHRDRSV